MKHLLCASALSTVVAFNGLLGVTVGNQATSRTIPYDGHLPISARVRPSDTRVVVMKKIPQDVPRPVFPESFEQETRRISIYDSIAVVTISDLQGQLVDEGKWIRTRLRGQTVQVIKRGSLVPQRGRLEFWEDGGLTQIGSVSVSAEPYTKFTVDQSYLLFLRMDSGRGTPYAALAYYVHPNGTLRSVTRSDGTSIWPDSSLLGKRLSEVADALRK